MRDCAKPNLSRSDAAEPWIVPGGSIDRFDKAEIDARVRLLHRSRTPAFVAIGVTGALLAGVAVSYLEYAKYDRRTTGMGAVDDLSHVNDYNQMKRWQAITSLGVVGTLASGAVSAYLWSRDDARLMVNTDGAGAAVGYAGRF
jgi:hypothetical protein